MLSVLTTSPKPDRVPALSLDSVGFDKEVKLPEVLPSIPSQQRTEAPNRQSQSELSGAVLFV